MKKILISLSLGIALGMNFAAQAGAATFSIVSINPNLPGAGNLSQTGPAGWVVGFYNFALIIAGVLAFGAIVYGGFLYATSAGNASRQSDGRAWITSALLGLLLLSGAYIILKTVNPNLVNLKIAPISSISSNNTGGGSGSNP